MRLCPNAKRIKTMFARWQRPFQAHPEIGGMPRGTSPHFSDAASVPQGMLKRSVQRVRSETQRIKKIALAGAILPDEEVQTSQSERAPGNAHKILQHDFTKKDGWIRHMASLSGSQHDQHTKILPNVSKNYRQDPSLPPRQPFPWLPIGLGHPPFTFFTAPAVPPRCFPITFIRSQGTARPVPTKPEYRALQPRFAPSSSARAAPRRRDAATVCRWNSSNLPSRPGRLNTAQINFG